jgi:cell division protein FtsI (penicillin-binding protein 3)
VLPRARFRLLAALLAVWATLVWLRLAQVQLLEHDRWRSEAEGQSERIRRVQEARGSIFTRDDRLLAGSLASAAVCANPTRIPRAQWAAVAAGLAPLVHQTQSEVLGRFRSESGFFYLAKGLDPDVESEVKRLRQRAVWSEHSERRVYPHGTLAGPLIGFVDGDGVGQAGLERSYDKTLAGIPSEYRLLCDGRSLPTAIDLRLEKAGRPGRALVLSIDSRVQFIVERELQRTLEDVGGLGAAAVVMDPYNGELLAVASLPGYDPARPGEVDAEMRRDRAVEDAIEPGSVFKPIVVAAALESGVLRPYDLVDCSGGGVQVAGVFIRDHASYGLLPVGEVIARSSNAGAIRIAQRTTPSRLDAFIRGLGFGEPTGVELPGETAGIYRGPQSWSALSRAGLALGEEIVASPLQIAQAYAAFANGGLLVHPRLVLETREPGGTTVTPYRRQSGSRVMSRTVAQAMTTMLQAVVDHGTGVSAQVPGYRTAGKTGTAQKPSKGSLRSGIHASWFAGFVPVYHPRFVIVVFVDEPRATYWASEVAAPAFSHIATRLVTLFGVPPSEVKAV